MTIKDFAKLCACNPQTLRYYDKEDLLKPANVDAWTGYRYYSEEQALDFVKIKNLQDADFSIKEIKSLMEKSDEEVYLAFEQKIKEQAEKLARIKEIQATYLSEKQKMEAKIREIKERLFLAAKKYDPREEFGISMEYYDQLIGKINDMFEESIKVMGSMNVDFSDVEVGDADCVTEETEYHNLLRNGACEVLFEKHNWDKTKEVIRDIPKLDNGEYMLYYEVEPSKMNNILFCSVILSLMMDQNEGMNLKLSCDVTESKDGLNHFWLLKTK